jgi:hypothetical protein
MAGLAGRLLGVGGGRDRPLYAVAAPVTPSSPASPPTSSPPPATGSPAAPSSTAAGPPLSSMPYASFAYEVWPGPVSADGKLALSRWTLTVTRQAGGITVKAAHDGQQMASVSHFYPGGAKVYILDSDLNDNAAGITDEGLEVTNAQGQVLP